MTTSTVFVLCKDTVIKRRPAYQSLPEARALDFVLSHTSVPVPNVRRYINKDGKGYLLMEKIEGTPLDRLWGDLSEKARQRVVSTLGGYIDQLRQASAIYNCPFPGPMAEKEPQMCDGPWMLLGDRPTGPFPTCKDLFQFINKYSPQPLDYSPSLVLTHMDLNMRNIIVGTDRKIWVVDWEWSGFYPPWFEYITMINAAFNDDAPASWRECVPKVTGDWSKEQRMLGYHKF